MYECNNVRKKDSLLTLSLVTKFKIIKYTFQKQIFSTVKNISFTKVIKKHMFVVNFYRKMSKYIYFLFVLFTIFSTKKKTESEISFT